MTYRNIQGNQRQVKRLKQLANSNEPKVRRRKPPYYNPNRIGNRMTDGPQFSSRNLVLFRPKISQYPSYSEDNNISAQVRTDIGSYLAEDGDGRKLRTFSAVDNKVSECFVIPKLDLFRLVNDLSSTRESDTSTTYARESVGIADYVGNPIPALHSDARATSGLVMLDNKLLLQDDIFSRYSVKDTQYLPDEYLQAELAAPKEADYAYHHMSQIPINLYYTTANCGSYAVEDKDLANVETTYKDVIEQHYLTGTITQKGLDNFLGYDRVYDGKQVLTNLNYAARFRHGPGCGLFFNKEFRIKYYDNSNVYRTTLDSTVATSFYDAVQMNNDKEVCVAGLPKPQFSGSYDYCTDYDNWSSDDNGLTSHPLCFPEAVWLDAFWVDVELVKDNISPELYEAGSRPTRQEVSTLSPMHSYGVSDSFSFTPYLWDNPETNLIESMPGRSDNPFLGMFKYMKGVSDGTVLTGWKELADSQTHFYDKDDNPLTPDYFVLCAFPIYVREATAQTGESYFHLVDKFTPRNVVAYEELGETKYRTLAAERYQVLCCGYVLPNMEKTGVGVARTPAERSVLLDFDWETSQYANGTTDLSISTTDAVDSNSTLSVPYVAAVSCDESGELVVTTKYLNFYWEWHNLLSNITGTKETSTIHYLSQNDSEADE